jgi:hypothetical protein
VIEGSLKEPHHTAFSGSRPKRQNTRDITNYDASFNNETKFTALVGLHVDLGMNFKANVQGTFVSSRALTIGICYCF